MNRNIQPTSLSAAIDEFAAHLRAKRRAKNTVDGYVYVLQKALKTWGDISTDAIEPIHIDRFFAAGNWADSTQNQYLASLRVFFKWLRNSRYTWPDHDPTVTWEVARVRSKDRLRLSPDEFYPLMDACSHPRDRAVVALALFTLLRGSEIATLKWADVDFGAGLLHAVHHKTKLEDAKPIGEELREELVAWQNWYRLDQGTIKPEWFLVPAKGPDFYEQDPATKRLVRDTRKPAHLKPTKKLGKPYEVIKRPLKALGYDTRWEGVHTLRRSGGSARFQELRGSEGADFAIMEVASLLGHTDVKVSQRYIGWNIAKEQRNESIIGKRMYPSIQRDSRIRLVRGGEHGSTS